MRRRERLAMEGCGVQITVPDEAAGPGQVLPMVVARDAGDAELVATAAAGGARTQIQVLRELSDEEACTYGLDLARHGDATPRPRALTLPSPPRVEA